MVVDCGTNGNAGVAPEDALLDELMHDTRRIETIVVTHFDADHWKGLQRFSRYFRRMGPPRRPVEFVYPALLHGAAGDVQKAFLVFEMLNSAGPVSHALDLMGTWRRRGATVIPRPIRRGLPDFHGAGQSWAVHWPPADTSSFYPRTRDAIEALGTRVRQLANDVPEFRDALNEVQRLWFTEQRDGDNGTAVTEVTGVGLRQKIDAAMAPAEMEDVGEKLQKYNNMLSLVHTGHGVANFGDCEGAGLSALMRLEAKGRTLANTYPVILAPHHGSHAPRVRAQQHFPHATTALVSQNGRQCYEDGQRPAQLRFKHSITARGARIRDTFDPRFAPSVFSHHHHFHLP